MNTHFAHFREFNDVWAWQPSPKGGGTVAYRFVEKPNHFGVAYTVALCSPKDRFNRKIGRAVAGGRMDNMENGGAGYLEVSKDDVCIEGKLSWSRLADHIINKVFEEEQ